MDDLNKEPQKSNSNDLSASHIISVVIAIFVLLTGLGGVLASIIIIGFVMPQLKILQESLSIMSQMNPYLTYLMLVLAGPVNIFLGVKILKNPQRIKKSIALLSASIIINAIFAATITLSVINPIYKATSEISTENTIINSAPDPTTNWKTYTNPKFGFVIKHPPEWSSEKCPEGFGDSICSEVVAETANDTEPLFYFIYFNEGSPPDTMPGIEEINYREETINNIQVLRTFGLPSRSGAESVFFKRNGNKYILIGFTPYDMEPLFPEQIEHYNIFNQILSTFKFIDPDKTGETSKSTGDIFSGTTNGAELANIKYTLPQGWTAKLNADNLFIAPGNGGYFSITVYNYPGTIGRREYYCQVTKYCIEGESYFNAMKIGNIDGYKANAIDNSGGGAEYFGAKGNRFYIISSYNPPSPNEFENNREAVLNSLIF